MANENLISAANQNGETAQKVSGDTLQTGVSNIDTSAVNSTALQTMLNRAQQFKASQAKNDNSSNGDNGGDDTPPSSPTGMVVEDSVEDSDGNPW